MQLLEVGDVALERLLGRDRDPLDLRLEPALVDPAVRGRGAASRPCRAAGGGAPSSSSAASVADRGMPRCAKALLRAGADAGEQPDVERREERRLLAGADDGEAAGLAPVGGDLGDDLARGDAERAGQRARAADGGLDGLGELAGRRGSPARSRRGRGSPRRSRSARPSGRPRGRAARPSASTGGRGVWRGRTKTASGQRRSASAQLIAEWMPKRRAT